MKAIPNSKKQGTRSRSGKLFDRKQVKTESIYIFANHLATLLDAGISLLYALDILAQQSEDKYFKKVLNQTSRKIREGGTLTQALSDYPDIFSNLTLSMVRAGEVSGNLVITLTQLSHYLKKQYEFEKKFKSATAYPKFIMGFFIIILAGIIFALVPKFQEIFASFDAKLPVPTLILISASEAIKDHLLAATIVVTAGFFLFKKYKKSASGRYFIDRMMLKVPLFGDVLVTSSMARFSQTLGILLQSGMSLVDALDIAGATMSNTLFRNALKEVKMNVIEGGNLRSSLQKMTVFPTLVVNMVGIGEESGSLETMLEKVSEIYTSHVESKLDSLLSLIEPALMLGLGLLALVVIVALYLPIFNMSSVIH